VLLLLVVSAIVAKTFLDGRYAGGYKVVVGCFGVVVEDEELRVQERRVLKWVETNRSYQTSGVVQSEP
jgi:hypothetical protein